MFQSLEPRLLFAGIELSVLSSIDAGKTAEIVAHDPRTQRLFAISAEDDLLTILDVADASNPVLFKTVDVSAVGSPNSVAVRDGVVAVALDNPEGDFLPGSVAFFKTNGQLINVLPVGATPDMVLFTPDGPSLLVANEGQPKSYGKPDSIDAEGSVSIVHFSKGLGAGNIKKLTAADVSTASFASFNDDIAELRAAGVRIYGPDATVAQDIEPEYITVAPDGVTAYVSLQENNAIATLDIPSATITAITPLGYKNHNAPGNGIDASDRDTKINIANWPVLGMYQPDAIYSYSFGGQTFIVTANEGDARDYSGFAEEARVGSVKLDPTVFPDGDDLKKTANLGRLRITNTQGDTDGDGDFDELYSFGGRSFSIFTPDGTLIYDSGDDLEQITAAANPEFFNASNSNNILEDRSDDKGPEPEGLALGTINGRTYAFLGLERIGGIMVFDVTDPAAPQFLQYINNRDFTKAIDSGLAGDLGPEGVKFIPAEESPTGQPLLAVANEISGTVTLYAIATAVAAAPAAATSVSSSAPVSSSVASPAIAAAVAAELPRVASSNIASVFATDADLLQRQFGLLLE
ncbi:MAG TPA: choice-of-anchor I family protein [Tepidisphaeraceae bacterium]|jgi:DNA-binding beta-propeller fold protein YncE|nr:choice-of-anchor I family protein [Tepidisphaeraceae bacterium]